MTEIRCKEGDFNFVCEMGRDNSLWYARTAFPLVEVINDRFLMNMRPRVRVGDFFHLIRHANDKWQSVLEVCKDLIVTTNDTNGVEILQTAEIISTNKPGEIGYVVDRGFNGRFVIRLNGTADELRNTIVEANEYAEMEAKRTGLPVKLMDLPAPHGRRPNAQKAA